jgi:hypothetical protein
MRMPGPPRQAALAIELALRGASQPSAIGTLGSFEPTNSTSLPAGSNRRSARNRSASVVSDETNSFAATGPVISIASACGGSVKRTPSPRVS